MADSIATASDSELLNIANQVIEAIQTTPAKYGLTAAFVTAMQGARDNFDNDLTGHVAQQASAKAQTVKKNGSRDIIAGFVRDSNTSAKAAKASEADIALMGIPSSSQAAPANATVPLAMIDTSKRLHHTISFRDAGTPDNKKKPRGVVGAEIWVKIGSPEPAGVKDCVFLGLDTLTPYTANYEAEEAGKMAYYMLRWNMRDGTLTPFGETVSATITG